MLTVRRVLFVRRLLLFVALLLFVVLMISPHIARAQDPAPSPDGGEVAGDVVSPAIPTALTIGAALSAILAFSPGINTWFNALPNGQKRLILLLLSVAIGLFLLITKSPPGSLSNFTWQDGLFFVQNVIAALLATQVQNTAVNRPLLRGGSGG